MPNYEIVAEGRYWRELFAIYDSIEDVAGSRAIANKFFDTVESDISKLSYLAGTSARKYTIAGGRRKYYRLNVYDGRYAVFYTINKRENKVRLWHILYTRMNFRAFL